MDVTYGFFLQNKRKKPVIYLLPRRFHISLVVYSDVLHGLFRTADRLELQEIVSEKSRT
jgi:hypothetical protein